MEILQPHNMAYALLSLLFICTKIKKNKNNFDGMHKI